MQTTDPSLRLGMTDIASLARVQRPVVSMWRRRAAGTDHPFPAAVYSYRGQDFFNAADVAHWLTKTGRGNNGTAAVDVAAFAAVGGASPREDRTAFDALTGLLCLKVMTAQQLSELDHDELLDLADAYDPDDELLYAELEAAGEQLEVLARHTDLLADAAFSPRAAFEKLMTERLRSLPEQAAVSIKEAALSLTAKVAVELACREGIPTAYADLTPGSSDLLLSVVGEHGDRGAVDVMSAQGDDASARLVRRRLRVHDVYREGILVDAGDLDPTRSVMHVAQLPTPAEPAMSTVQILETVENLVLQMAGTQRGVVIAPASALSDSLSDESAVRIRDDIVRAGHAHAIVRLPKGLVRAKSRQALTLWVLGPAQHDEKAADRHVLVADLIDETLTADVVDSLVTDLVAAASGSSLVRTHASRFTRPVPTRVLLAARRNLVEVGAATKSPARVDGAHMLVRLEQARAAVDRSVHPTPALPRLIAAEPRPAHLVSLGAMLAERSVRLLPGNRIDDADLGADGGVRVIGVDELVGASVVGTRTIDRLALAATYDAARFTEPGDVVFCTSPRPAAIVDRDGSSVVAYPARVLRIDVAEPGGLLAEVLAAGINEAPERARAWRQWPVRRVRDDQRTHLVAAYEELRRVRQAAQRHLADVDQLTRLITDAVTSGAVDLEPEAEPTRGR